MTAENTYTVQEIDRLRAAIQTREIPHPNPYTSEDVTQWRIQLDSRCMFYMRAGIRAEEIETKPDISKHGYV